MPYVHNINGTKDRKPYGYSSWLEFWKKKSGKTKSLCAAKDCTNAVAVGAHVQKDGSNDRHWYITPLCYSCNAKSESFFVSEDNLVRVTEDD